MPLLFLDNWFNNAFIQALGWTLFHSLWQGFLLVVLVSLAIVLTRRSTATIRYRIFSTLFFIFLGTTLCTFIIEYSSLRSIPTPALLTGNEIGDILTLSTNSHAAAVDSKVPIPGRLAFYFNEYGSWLMLIWFIVFMLKSIRLGINYAQVQRIRNEKPYVLPAIEKRVNELAKLLRIRRKVILRETTSITVPVTIGFLKPLILVPCGLINNLPPEQVEAILLHELAHIRRMDYLVNLLQCLAETVFFFNPAVLWLSSLLREERENCCDDIAITVTQNKSLFIHALVAFQEYQVGHPMAPGLQGTKYPLLKRIQRIVYNNNKKLNHMEKIFLAAGLVVTGIVALAFTSPSTDKTNKPAEFSTTQPVHPSFNLLKDSVPKEQTREAQKRKDEVLLMDKVMKEQLHDKQLADMETQADLNTKMKLFIDDEKGKQLFNQEKQKAQQDKFFKELQDDKVLKDLQLDKNQEALLYKMKQDNNYGLLLLDKQKKGENDKKIMQDFLLQEDKLNDNKYAGEAQPLFQKQQKVFQDRLQLYLDERQDTSKPKRRDEKRKAEKEEAELEKKREHIQEEKERMKERMRSEAEDHNERMRKMDEYRAMLKKELSETERDMDREKRKAEKDKRDMDYKLEMEGLKGREKAEKEREKINEERAERKDRDDKRREEIEERRKELREEAEERRNDTQKEMEERRKEQQRNMEERRKVQRIEMEQRRKESDQRRAELIKELKADGIIPQDADNISININDEEMVVNGVKQPDNVFKKYREKLGKKPTKANMPKPAPITPVLKLEPTTYQPPKLKLSAPAKLLRETNEPKKPSAPVKEI